MSDITERAAFENWYLTQGKYSFAPIGSRDCSMQWEAWAARALMAREAVEVPPGWKLVPVEPTPEMLEAVARFDSKKSYLAHPDVRPAWGGTKNGDSVEAWNLRVSRARYMAMLAAVEEPR